MLPNILHRRHAAAFTPSSSRLGYLPGLDGLRALAVLAVLLYHADVLWLPGGFLGVEVFFVVSGYLITSLLLAEYRTHNRINLKNFWQRRARRLLPALFAVLIAVLVYMALWLPDEVAGIRADVLAAFTYVTNWYLIAAEKSYFETIGRPSLLRHLWSLAVEEQFYLLWPLIFTFVLARLKTRGALLLLMLGAFGSALGMGLLYQPDADPSRVYYGTDTRAAGLLIGAALAFVWFPKADDSPRNWRHWLLDAIGLLAMGGLVAAGLFLDEFSPFMYQGGMLLVSTATAFVIAAVVHPKSPLLAPLLSIGILQWIGLRSYGLYLWHWPLFMVTRPQLDTPLEGAPLLVFRFALTFLIAEISYRVVETPIRRFGLRNGGGLGKAWNAWTQTRGVRRWSLGAAAFVIFGVMLAGGVTLGNVVVNAQPPPQPDFVLAAPAEETSAFAEEEAIVLPPEQPDQVASPVSSDMVSVSFVSRAENQIEEQPEPIAAAPAAPVTDSWVQRMKLARTPIIHIEENDFDSAFRRAPPRSQKKNQLCAAGCLAQLEFREWKGERVKPAVLPKREPTPAPKPLVTKVENPLPPRAGPAQVLAIGDSVMLGASHYMRKTVLALDVDAKIGRQVSTAIRLLQAYKDANRLAPIVLIHLGNNGTFSTKQFDELMTLLSGTPRVVFLTTKVPRKWQAPNNNALVEGVKRYPNALLIDWNAASAPHPEWFWKDGIHLRPEGAQVYANLIATTLEQAQAHP
ncbi:MAG: acetyltransferase [Chloroflexi bacterium]|nr:acetyltransferase [Chloroflexota bacterium]